MEFSAFSACSGGGRWRLFFGWGGGVGWGGWGGVWGWVGVGLGWFGVGLGWVGGGLGLGELGETRQEKATVSFCQGKMRESERLQFDQECGPGLAEHSSFAGLRSFPPKAEGVPWPRGHWFGFGRRDLLSFGACAPYLHDSTTPCKTCAVLVY